MTRAGRPLVMPGRDTRLLPRIRPTRCLLPFRRQTNDMVEVGRHAHRGRRRRARCHGYAAERQPARRCEVIHTRQDGLDLANLGRVRSGCLERVET